MAHSQAALELTELAVIYLNEIIVSMDLLFYHKTSHAWDISASSNIFLLVSTAHVLLNAMEIVKRLNQKDLCLFFSFRVVIKYWLTSILLNQCFSCITLFTLFSYLFALIHGNGCDPSGGKLNFYEPQRLSHSDTILVNTYNIHIYI